MPPRSAARRPRNVSRSKCAASITPPAAPTVEQIRQRAYEIYLARNGRPGNPDWDWQQAELELRARIALLGKP